MVLSARTCFRHFLYWRKLIISLTLPLLLLPIPLAIQTQWAKCAYALALMASFWLLELIPLAATSLLPVFLFPLLGILSTEAVCKQYMQDTIMIFMGSLIAATAVEHCGLHQRIALKVLSAAGAQPRWLLLGFMFTTTVLSMWMSNTAAMALMVPIVEAVLLQLTSTDEEAPPEGDIKLQDLGKTSEDTDEPEELKESQAKSQADILRAALYLGICYGSNIGGTGTLTGSIPNFILLKEMEVTMPEYKGVTFANWLIFNLPTCLLCMVLAWIFLLVAYVRRFQRNKEKELEVARSIEQKYIDLGPISFQEGAVLFLFATMVILFFFRSPQFIPGWGDLFPKDFMRDAAVAIFITTLMFIIPSNPRDIKNSRPLLEWSVVHEKVSWNIIILLGGGFALAEGCKVSGLSNEMAQQLLHIAVDNRIAVQVIVCVLTMFLTEITSNAATATIILPSIGRMAKKMNQHPLLFMMPVCISSSCAFMLPMASGPTAIAYNAAGFTSSQLAIPGFFVKILCLGTIILATNTIGFPIFKLSDFTLFDIPEGVNNTTGLNTTDINSLSSVIAF